MADELRMDLKLTSQDQHRLQDTVHTLVSPLNYPELDGWRRAVNRSAKQLLGADIASFILPASGGPTLLSDDLDLSSAQQYPNRVPRIPGFGSFWERQVSLVVFNRARLYGPYIEEYHRSEYYNDYIVPARAYDSLGVTIPLATKVDAESVAGLLFHHDRPNAAPFGARGLVLLRLLLPGLRAGVDAHSRFYNSRQSLGRLIDAIGAALLVCDRAGRILHQTPQLVELLQADPERDRLLVEMRHLARTLTARAGPAVERTSAIGAPTQEVRTSYAQYRISGSHVDSGVLSVPSAIMVTLNRLTAVGPSDEVLRTTFGLTKQGARVARLLAEGKSNAGIAQALSISLHTARHHVEQVKLKLRVHSRAEVGAVILGLRR